MDVDQWNGGIVIEDGLFLACESELQLKTVMRSNLSSAALGGEGLLIWDFLVKELLHLNLMYQEGINEIELINDELKIDGNMAIACLLV